MTPRLAPAYLCLVAFAATVGAAETAPVSSLNSARFDDYRKYHEREHALEKQALDAAAISINYRLESMNELRAQLNTERGQFVSRILHDAAVAQLTARIEVMEKSQIASDSANKTWNLAIMGLFTVLALLSRYMPIRTRPVGGSAPAVPVVATTQTTTSTSAAPNP